MVNLIRVLLARAITVLTVDSCVILGTYAKVCFAIVLTAGSIRARIAGTCVGYLFKKKLNYSGYLLNYLTVYV